MGPFTNIISHILSNLGFHKNTYHITTKIGPQNYTIFTKRPKLIYLVGKPQKTQKTFLQSPLLHDASKSLLLYGTLKPVATWQYFYKMLKGPILLWHLFTKAQYYFGIYLQKPKYSKNPILFWHLFTKAQYYFGTYLQKPKYYFDKNNYIILEAQNYSLAKTYFHILKSLTHGKYKLLVPQKYFFYKIYGNYAYFFFIIN